MADFFGSGGNNANGGVFDQTKPSQAISQFKMDAPIRHCRGIPDGRY